MVLQGYRRQTVATVETDEQLLDSNHFQHLKDQTSNPGLRPSRHQNVWARACPHHSFQRVRLDQELPIRLLLVLGLAAQSFPDKCLA